ncbi:MAG: 30S ribosomal protein S6 [Oscillospiraceae bacterium]
MQKYESTMVISTKQDEETIKGLVEKFKTLIETNGTLVSVDEWGKRRLAYLINKESEGYYVLFTFESNSEFPAELDRVYKITEGLLRTMIIAL